MAAIAFPKLTTSTKLPNGTTYSYIHVKPTGNKPYILFCRTDSPSPFLVPLVLALALYLTFLTP